MKRLLFFLLMVYGTASAATTHIVDTIRYSDRSLASGRVIIQNQAFTSSAGNYVAAATYTVNVSNGYFSVYLEPNDAALPAGTSYRVQYQMNNPARGLSGLSSNEYWVVPTSTTQKRISQVRVTVVPSPSLVVQPSQINTTGAITGQLLKFDGNTIVWGGASGVFYFKKSDSELLGDSVRFTDSYGLTGTLNGNAFSYTIDSASWATAYAMAQKAAKNHRHDTLDGGTTFLGNIYLPEFGQGQILSTSGGLNNRITALSGNAGQFIYHNGLNFQATDLDEQAITSINGLTGALKIVGAGGATVSVSNDTMYINAGSGGEGGTITSIQPGDAILDFINPSGPTVTASVKANSIDSAKIKTGNVTSTDILDGGINTVDFAATAKAPLSTLADSAKKVDTTSFPIATDAELALRATKSTTLTNGYGLGGFGDLSQSRTVFVDTTQANPPVTTSKLNIGLAGKLNVGATFSTTDIVSGTLPVARGGTGVATIGASGTVLQSNGTAYAATLPVRTFTATIPPGTQPRKAVYVAGATSAMFASYSIGGSKTPVAMPTVTAATDSAIIKFYSVEDDTITVNGIIR